MTQQLASLQKAIARGIERSVLQVLDPVFKIGPRPSHHVVAKKSCIVLTVRFPFWLPPPNRDDVECLSTKKYQQELREGFARYLQQQNLTEDITRKLPVQLTEYLLQKRNLEKYPADVRKFLHRIPQRFLAGRKGYNADKQLKTAVRITVGDVWRWLTRLARTIRKHQDGFTSDEQIIAYLQRRLRSTDKGRVKSFLDLAEKLPHRRYVSKVGDAIEDDAQLYAKLSRPNDWDIKRISARIAQREIFDKTHSRPPLKLLESALNLSGR